MMKLTEQVKIARNDYDTTMASIPQDCTTCAYCGKKCFGYNEHCPCAVLEKQADAKYLRYSRLNKKLEKKRNIIKIIAYILLALITIYFFACWIDIAKNCGENPTFASWNIIYKTIMSI